MSETTLPSRHRIRNSSPGGLRPSTLPLGHGGSSQYWIFTSERGRNICFFLTAKTGKRTPNSGVKGIFNAWLMRTPKFRADNVALTRDVPTVKVWTCILSRDQGAHTTKYSVLSLLNFNLIYAIQVSILEHRIGRSWAFLVGRIELSSWNIYTAECHQHNICTSTLYFCAISPIGEVYIVNNIGPNTEPCGTLNLRSTSSDVTPINDNTLKSIFQIWAKPANDFSD